MTRFCPPPDLPILLSSIALLLFIVPLPSESGCSSGCELALASYYISQGMELKNITPLFEINFSGIDSIILPYNHNITSKDSIRSDTRINIPFPCECINGEYLAHAFPYTILSGDTYDIVADRYFANLTTSAWLAMVNSYPPNNIPDNMRINVTVNCSCGNRDVSKEYGLFVTYPLRLGETLKSVAAELQFSFPDLLQEYNPGVNFSAGEGIVFVPTKDKNGSYLPLPSRKGISRGAIAGVSIAVLMLLVLAVSFYVVLYRRKKTKKALFTSEIEVPRRDGYGYLHASTNVAGGNSVFSGITVDNSLEFSYEELAKATNDFSISNKIGSGGFGAVYYAELRGEITAIKKMDMQASKEFLAELKVLTHVHHLNLVRLIGYCTENSLFLVYEFIENGNLSEHLRGSGREPLSWASRVQVALDSARGLEYIHEHTVPVYIHRDIKSANILIDKNFHAKVADFGLAKLTEVGTTLQTKLAGTFGYMAPEYAQYGDASPKIDVYAFGVVLYELISAKAAILTTTETTTETKGLVALFGDALNQPDAREELRKLVDPRLLGNYPIEDVYKLAQLAKSCSQENPHLRPSMRSIVVMLMTLSSSTVDWDVGPIYENRALVNLMSGR